MNEVREKLAAYNVARSTASVAQNALVDAEKKLNIYSSQLLSSVASIYGKESDEYEITGGTRPSDRRRSRTTTKQDEAKPEQSV
ncbi:MAG: hypothetical protein ACFE0J_18700 [Elainellaceae cyanobacterium]